MNARATSLGAKNTHFTNPHGYHDLNHYTTPYDMALIAKAALSNPTVQKIAGTAGFNFYVSNRNKYIAIKNSSRLVKPETDYYNPAVVATKTGFHDAAGQTLVAKAVYGDMELIAVVMYEKTPNQYIDVNKLFDYATANYDVQKSDDTYTLINKTIAPWAQPNVTKAIEKGWVSNAANYNTSIYTEDLVAMLKKAGAAYNGVTMQEVYDLLGLKQGDLITRSDLAQILNFAANKWNLNLVIATPKTVPTDIASLSANAQTAIRYMIDRDLMLPLNSRFNPERTLTLAEAISTLDRMLP